MSFTKTPLIRFVLLAALSLFCVPSSAAAQVVEWGPWSVLAPLEYADGSSKVGVVLPPEEELSRMGLDGPGPELDKEHVGKHGKPVRWRPLNGDAEASLDPTTEILAFADHMGESFTAVTDSDNAAAYVYRAVMSDADLQQVLMLGSDDASRVWLNGELVKELTGARKLKQRSHMTLPLQRGTNHLLIKVVNGNGAWGLTLEHETKFTPEVRQAMQVDINASIDRGVDFLLKTQQVDGSWGYDRNGYRNGQTALSIYALLNSGVTPEHQAVQRGLAFLALEPPKKTYANAVQILALAATYDSKHDEWISELADLMQSWQDGDFAYPGGANDLSCTQYGAFAYWVASQRGVTIPKKAWTALAKSVLAYANEDGGFAYRPREESTGSMTVAGLTVLAVCEEGLGKAGFPRQIRKDVERVRQDGLRWMIENIQVEENPAVTEGKRKRWHYYYLYGVERLAALLQLERFGDVDWYWRGAEYLIDNQADDGAWSTVNGEAEPNTSFALLFLNRATATASGPGTSRKQGRQYATDETDSLVVMRAKGDTPLSLWLSELRPGLVETHAQVGPQGRGIYLSAVEYLANGESIARVEADPEEKWSSKPYATQYAFETRGEHEVQLVLHFAKLEGQPKLESVKSPVLTVRVDERLEPWMLEYVDDRQENLSLPAKREVAASSHFGDANNKSHTGDKAFDGLPGTSWISNESDPTPELRVTYKKALRIDRVILSHAANIELHDGKYDRATLVSIDFGRKGESYTLELDPEAETKHVLELPKPTKISKLNIRVLERVEGSTHKGCVGFSEVELHSSKAKKKRSR